MGCGAGGCVFGMSGAANLEESMRGRLRNAFEACMYAGNHSAASGLRLDVGYHSAASGLKRDVGYHSACWIPLCGVRIEARCWIPFCGVRV